MLKVLIADDENRIAKSLLTRIPWTQLGLSVAAIANNGKEALDLAQEHGVQIVITDIRMPKIDGLTLCQKLLEMNPDIQIIIISGYADFSYAQEAIRLQILGYCLKPINYDELTALLRIAIRNLSFHKLDNSDALLDSIEERNMDNIIEAFENIGYYSVSYYVAVSIGIYNIQKQLNANISIKLGKHKYLYFSTQPFDKKTAMKIICCSKSKCGIGLLPDTVSLNKLHTAISDATIMAYQYFINGNSLLCDSLIGVSLVDDVFIKLKNFYNKPDMLKIFLQDLQQSNYTVMFNIRTALRFYNEVYSSESFINFDFDEYYLCSYEQLAVEYSNFDEVLKDMLSNIHNLESTSTFEPNSTRTFLPIIKYLHNHFNEDISLKSISNMFHLNPSYLSQLIKSETGLTYTQYITTLRINKAKELLLTSDFSLQEISESIGFNDYFYFIKKFKKEVGITPGKFSQQMTTSNV